MATLTNLINPQNIVDRFADFVVLAANQSIVWGTNANPTSDTSTVSGVQAIVEVISDVGFGGSTSGKAIEITGSNITTADGKITASNIYNTLVAETNRYTRIRKARAILRVSGTGGNSGTRLRQSSFDSTRTFIEWFNSVQVSHLNSSYQTNITISPASTYNLTSGSKITVVDLENFFTALKTAYNAIRNTEVSIVTNVCHASCHSSCHGSRGRR